MAIKRRHPLREVIKTAAGILLILASLVELLGVLGQHEAGLGRGIHLFFSVISVVGALLIFLKIRYAAYVVLPLALTIFFYEVYLTASATVSLYTIISGVFFLMTALLCFMLIRAHKI